jgi:hypothetical protein
MNMKTKILFAAFLLPVVFLMTGCEDKELGNPLPSTVANFSYTMTNNGYAPCEVDFTNLSLNASGYHWDFGNGETSSETNPTITYDSVGIYSVSLTCASVNDVYYNKLIKSVLIIAKDPAALPKQVLYFTSRNPEGGAGHYVVLSDSTKQIIDFDPVDLNRPYGIAADTTSRKVFITDFNLGCIYSFDADGKNPDTILSINVPGQEIVDYPEGIFTKDNKIYWGRPGGIYRSNFDGTQPELHIEMSLTVAPEYPIDMQYDPVSDRIYFVNDRTDYTGGLFYIKFDEQNATPIIPDIDGTAIEVDFETGKIYMAVFAVDGSLITENGMYMCNLDGSELTKFGDFGAKATWGIAIDHEQDKLFWGYKISNSDPDGKIIRANLDGSNQEDWITGISPHAMQIVWIKL